MKCTGRWMGLALGVVAAWATVLPAAEMSDAMPSGTMLYVSWPGADALGKASKDTAWGQLMAEPEIVRFAERWNKEIWPALDEMIRENIGSGPESEVYQQAVTLLAAAWKYPTALGVGGVDIAPDGPKVDIGLIIRAGADAKKLADSMDTILKTVLPAAPEAGAGGLRETMLPGANLPLRYGVNGDDFVLSVGTKFPEHWVAKAAVKALTGDERFAAAMKVTHGSGATPVIYVDLKGIIETLNKFQPLFAGANVPVVGEAGGLQKLLDGLGLGTIQSLSFTMRPEAGGFVTTCFLHAPGIGEGAAGALFEKPLTDDDLKVVPRDVTYATVTNFDLAAVYQAILSAVKTVAPDVHSEVAPKIEAVEQQIGVNIEKDLLGSFGDTWAIYDAPENGGIWFTGVIVVGELKPGNKLDESLDKIVKAIAGAVGDKYPVSIREETYREKKIRFVNVGGLPIPVAPAWATVGQRWVFGLYPQMVRAGIDQLAEKGPTLLDNADFQRGRKQMPAGYSSITYTDTAGGVRFLHSLAVPVGATLANWAQAVKLPVDASLLPSARTLTKHMFGNVSAEVSTKDGVLSVSYGAIPIPIPSMGVGGGLASVALFTSISLPALAHARESARATVDMTNLRQIGLGCLVYAEDHDGQLPPSLEALTEGENAPLKKQVLKSPRDASGAEVSYVYVKGQKNTMNPQNIVAYEDPKLHPNEDRINVLFLDGHVQSMSKEQFESALDETKERIKEDSK